MATPVPPILYKYLSADRLDVLTSCRIRFTQRRFFSDDHELQPDYDAFGTVDEIERHIVRGGPNPLPWLPPRLLARLIAVSDRLQRNALQTALKNIKSIDQMGILCLTANARSERMWCEYARNGTGFAIGFETAHAGFRGLTAPRGVGQVTYSSEGFPTFLGMLEKSVFEALFRKRMEFAFEEEWRSVRLLKDLGSFPNDVFLAPFDPGSICEILIGPNCALEPQLRDTVGGGNRYQHARVMKAEAPERSRREPGAGPSQGARL